ncbi:MAG: GspE/PulE family protein [Candidatus Paceibacterota bacterium]|jgi:type IV pilus assembly protein PilB|nr:GspE/PulE family protein [Candidatus Paceibacterota bacterium]MDD3548771.1 GspE/PulE family protein [Candidatus Paceibacterota bacterium]MDD4999250.1 GspE/PulE family protein [Candidatus Paceibacterota bacterium]MDD5545392.1 GspE/PulE family protein [Candidatus Paceibacterota bacterium]
MEKDEIFLATLIQRGIISEINAQKILEEAKTLEKRAEEIIRDKQLADENVLANIKGEIFKLPVKIFSKNEVIPTSVLNLIPEDTARHYKFIAFNKEGNVLSIGMVYPDELKAQEAVRFITNRLNLEFKVFIIKDSDLKEILKQYQTFAEEFNALVQDFQRRFGAGRVRKDSFRLVDLESTAGAVAEEAPIIKLFASILKQAVRSRSSDIHIEAERNKLRVRFRVDGNLATSLTLPSSVHQAIISRVKIMANLKIDETRLPQDGRFFAIIDEKEIDFRVSTFPTTLGEKVAIRILDPTVGLKSIHELGIEGKNLEILEEEIKKPYGMILLTGPTGSGKTTTLYAVMQVLNQDNVNIVSLEDPVEYTMEGINQSQVLPEIGYTFARGLRHIVRQDPDIIMVGEIRDKETAELATHAALTGHLVLSTLHTNNAIGVIPRLVDLGVDAFLVPPSLNLMIGQRLCRRLCPDCKKRILANETEQAIIDENVNSLPKNLKEKFSQQKPYHLYKSQGCSNCNQKGYLGRIGIFEILKMTPDLEQIILTQPSQEKLLLEAKKQEMITLRQSGIIKVLEGLVSLEEVLAITTKS